MTSDPDATGAEGPHATKTPDDWLRCVHGVSSGPNSTTMCTWAVRLRDNPVEQWAGHGRRSHGVTGALRWDESEQSVVGGPPVEPEAVRPPRPVHSAALVPPDSDNPDEVQLLAHGWVLTFSDYRDGRGWWLTVKSTVSDLVDSPAVEIPRSAMGPLAEWLAERSRLVQGGA